MCWDIPAISCAPETVIRARADLVLVSFLLLFLELACIRWFPAHVLFLTFFTNTILLASFLGLSVGCLLADRPRHWLTATPVLLAASMWAAQLVGLARDPFAPLVGVGDPLSPQLVYFGAEYAAKDPARFLIPIELVAGFFYLCVALTMIGPGQELGRAFARVANRLEAYTLNIAGSLAGIAAFALCSWLESPPTVWFAIVLATLVPLLLVPRPDRPRANRLPIAGATLAILGAALLTTGGDTHWSPYYRIDYRSADRFISVNLLGHQVMVARDDRLNPSPAYALPHLLRRDTAGTPFQDVLVIGAGSGNDVSRALAWGARRVDAVEIDPAIQRLGQAHHPDRPYDDPRVTRHITDGRNFLRQSTDQYDLIVFALIDSLVLHSGYSNVRLESFMYTREALADARARLKPGGMLVMYNYFRQGWIVARLRDGLHDAFGDDPLVLTLPYMPEVRPEASEGFTMLLAGNVEPIRTAFDAPAAYWLPRDGLVSPSTPDGFRIAGATSDTHVRIGPAAITDPGELPAATDDWPFLYLRRPLIPFITLRGVAVMAAIAIALFVWQRRGATSTGPAPAPELRMFLLGAGFMLVETTAVVHMALIFGSTWMVNTFVFAGVLVMVLAANLLTGLLRPRSLTPYYIGLFITLALNLAVPLDALLGFSRTTQAVLATLLAFAPIFFAGLIFATCFSRSRTPGRAFGANVAGAMTGGFLENFSLLLGFRGLTLVVIACYVGSAFGDRSKRDA